MDSADDAAWLHALHEDAGLSAQIIHLQVGCTFHVKKRTKKFECKLTGDVKLMMVTNGGGKCWWGCPDASRLVPVEDTVNKIQWGAFLRSEHICIGDYAHTGCRVTNAFKKRLPKNYYHLNTGCFWSVSNSH